MYSQARVYDVVLTLGEARQQLNTVIKSKGSDYKSMRRKHTALRTYVGALMEAKKACYVCMYIYANRRYL